MKLWVWNIIMLCFSLALLLVNAETYGVAVAGLLFFNTMYNTMVLYSIHKQKVNT